MTATCSQTVQLQPQQPSASGVRLELRNGNRVSLYSELDLYLQPPATLWPHSRPKLLVNIVEWYCRFMKTCNRGKKKQSMGVAYYVDVTSITWR